MGNVKRCGQVYVYISTAVKNRSVILYFCCSKLLDLFIYFLAHLTTTTHLSVSLAPMQNATKACAAQSIHFGILFVIFFICSVVSLASASLLLLFFLWLSFLCQTNQHRFFLGCCSGAPTSEYLLFSKNPISSNQQTFWNHHKTAQKMVCCFLRADRLWV